MNLCKVADLSEVRVTGHNDRSLFNRTGKDEAVGIGDAVFAFVLSRLVDKLIGNRKDGEVHPVDVGQDLDLSLIAELAFSCIDDFAEVDRAEIFDPSSALRGPEPPLNGDCTVLPLEKFEEGMAIKDESCRHAKSLLRFFSNFLVREGFRGRNPAAALMGSVTGGIK